MAKIKVTQLEKEFDVPSGVEVAVDGVDISVDDGEFFTIVGPSGCGKTTTLRCIAGLEFPTSGSIEFGGKEVTDVPAEKREIAMMFQNIALYPHMTVRDNIAYPLKIRDTPKEQQEEEVRKAAEILQIPELLDKYPGELSGGQRQRAALARTIVQHPVAFLMDEPLSDLDAKLKVEIRKEIQRVHKRVGRPTVYVTHDQEEALTMSDRIAVLNDGQVEQIGTPNELYTHPNNLFVADFIGNPSMNFLDGELESFNGNAATVRVNDKTFEFSLEYTEEEPSNQEIVVGFRPESVSLDSGKDPADLTGQITLLEQIGDRMLATIETTDKEIRATIPMDAQLSEGQETSIWVQRDGVYLFNSESTELIGKCTTT